ncbi:DHH family phosphoesterase [Aequorivita lipolytica]|uniref:Bifunctional oligoribonuclease/PAP phosphatase NrnA n=1 Tax=Aequorivita lipolytica TaxID=153267 RepID=A0A5C6YLE5_9FLAO|nr:bifunctional oligoribonuclease/PAP phosphatase NrnA [Aequorivita lipolytica]TXD68089.1 bifunctional oligoribonuclease/PAP phosphatase NrnA [Aequorivita lipolytica]SRX53641.1 Bifunctional oligoribonuclease and PAP phosphatase NrnA [Aequorivita lipolytica]
MKKDITETVIKLLASPQKVVIVGHKNPDGDAVGSCLGLSFFLKSLGHSPNVIMPNDFPDFLKWLPGCEDIVIYEKEVEKSKELFEKADLIFTLDFNSLDRVGGELQTILENATAKFVMIDHHQQPAEYAVATYSDVKMSSTSEMVYHFMDALGETSKLSKEIAINLYTGIMTDTGSFRFASSSPTTHRVAAKLIEAGAESAIINQNVYDTNSPDRMKLLGVALNNLVILPELHTAYITMTQKELDDNNFKKGDTEGFVNYALSVKGVVFAIIFIENKQESIVKISLRSKGDFSVNDFARNHYSGGGHINAAGGKSSQDLNKTINEFISILPRYKNELTDAL